MLSLTYPFVWFISCYVNCHELFDAEAKRIMELRRPHDGVEKSLSLAHAQAVHIHIHSFSMYLTLLMHIFM